MQVNVPLRDDPSNSAIENIANFFHVYAKRQYLSKKNVLMGEKV